MTSATSTNHVRKSEMPLCEWLRSWWREYWAWSLRELRSPVFWRDCAMEFLANAVLLTYVGMALITNNTVLYQPSTTTFGLFAGFMVYSLSEGYGPFSGALLNPTAAFSVCLTGRISLARGFLYIVFETMGCVVGSGIAYGFTPTARLSNPDGAFHAFNPADNGLTVAQGLGVEGVLGFNMVFIALSVHDRARSPPAFLPNLAVVFGITSGIIAAGTFTAGLANPMIALGPAVLSRDFTNHWIYWVGPFLGGALATGVYRLLVYIKLRYEPEQERPRRRNQDQPVQQQDKATATDCMTSPE